eukprot:8788887-Pyramimonas_sp.AAC.1
MSAIALPPSCLADAGLIPRQRCEFLARLCLAFWCPVPPVPGNLQGSGSPLRAWDVLSGIRPSRTALDLLCVSIDWRRVASTRGTL